MTRLFQAYNGRINAWVKYKTMPDKTTRIVEVKKREPKKPFANIKIN